MDDALEAHELIKIRMLSDDREQRSAWIGEVLKRTRSEKVHAIGKTLTMWRKRQPKKAKEGRAH
jgi:RNA-binding protein